MLYPQAAPFLAPTEEDHAEARRRRPRFTLTDAANLAESLLAVLGDPSPSAPALAAVPMVLAAPPVAQQTLGQVALPPIGEPVQLLLPAPQLQAHAAVAAPADAAAAVVSVPEGAAALDASATELPHVAGLGGGAAALGPTHSPAAEELAANQRQGHPAGPMDAAASPPSATALTDVQIEAVQQPLSGDPEGASNAAPINPSAGRAGPVAHAAQGPDMPPAPAFLLPAPELLSAAGAGSNGAPPLSWPAVLPAAEPLSGAGHAPAAASAPSAGSAFGSWSVSGPAFAQLAPPAFDRPVGPAAGNGPLSAGSAPSVLPAAPIAQSASATGLHGGAQASGAAATTRQPLPDHSLAAASPPAVPAGPVLGPQAAGASAASRPVFLPAPSAAAVVSPANLGASTAPTRDRGAALQAEVARLRSDMAARARLREERERRLAEVCQMLQSNVALNVEAV